jgi:hypothetical protein
MYAAVAVLLALLLGPAIAADKASAPSGVKVVESFPIDPDDELLTIPVCIDGKFYPFVLDTGATANLFDPSLRTHFHGPVARQDADFIGTIEELEIYACPFLSVGGLPIANNQRACCRDLTLLREALGSTAQGILGNVAFRDKVVRLDFDHNRVEFLEDFIAERDECGEPVFCLFLNRSFPVLELA